MTVNSLENDKTIEAIYILKDFF